MCPFILCLNCILNSVFASHGCMPQKILQQSTERAVLVLQVHLKCVSEGT